MSLPLLEIPLQGRNALVTGGDTVAVNHLGQDPDAHALLAAFERDGSPDIAANADLTAPTAVQTMADLVRATG
ncbi:hypothetical protein [Streptomyces sp. NPDC059957]|uniref:hypothetical protein n=1 Tax=unclassified Streptomyces TaxID=2593676 RepID=UPI0036495792